MMKCPQLPVLLLVLASSAALADEPRELVTAPDAVLCLDADHVGQATSGRAARDRSLLRELGCLRSPAGVPATLLSGSDGVGTWSVRFRPEGMSGGITLWGRPSSFRQPDGSPLPTVRASR